MGNAVSSLRIARIKKLDFQEKKISGNKLKVKYIK